jgi:poly-gamma-glutamate synthesis protein (capsule biosynthesis protein)
VTTSPSRQVSLAAVGDMMMARAVGRHYEDAAGDFAMPDVVGALAGADIVCANLENPVAIGGRPDPVQDPHITFRAAPATLAILKTLGVGVVALGNNHMLDYGESALIETLEHLDACRIGRVGAGRNYQEANAPLLLECNGRRLAFLSFAFIYSANTRMATRTRAGISDHRLRRILPQIRELAGAGYDVIPMIHWGFEYCFFPLPYQMRQARRMIDAGARMVLGHGPHYPQGIERYGGRDIVYSLGNFMFDEPHKFANRSFIYASRLDDGPSAREHQLTPVHLRNHVPHVVEGASRRQMTGLLATLSRRYQTATPDFWREQSAAYLMDICGRVVRSHSLKFLRVPPLSFYRDVGARPILRKLKPATLVDVSRSIVFR